MDSLGFPLFPQYRLNPRPSSNKLQRKERRITRIGPNIPASIQASFGRGNRISGMEDWDRDLGCSVFSTYTRFDALILRLFRAMLLNDVLRCANNS